MIVKVESFIIPADLLFLIAMLTLRFLLSLGDYSLQQNVLWLTRRKGR